MPVLNVISPYLRKCLTLELAITNKKGYLITVYISASQISDEFEFFISNFGKLLISITSCDHHFGILLGGINTKSKILVS